MLRHPAAEQVADSSSSRTQLLAPALPLALAQAPPQHRTQPTPRPPAPGPLLPAAPGRPHARPHSPRTARLGRHTAPTSTTTAQQLRTVHGGLHLLGRVARRRLCRARRPGQGPPGASVPPPQAEQGRGPLALRAGCSQCVYSLSSCERDRADPVLRAQIPPISQAPLRFAPPPSPRADASPCARRTSSRACTRPSRRCARTSGSSRSASWATRASRRSRALSRTARSSTSSRSATGVRAALPSRRSTRARS